MELPQHRSLLSRPRDLQPYDFDRNRLSPQALANSIEQLEREIEAGQCLELGCFQGVGSFGTEPDSFFEVWPVQIAFHSIAWYLGYELASGEQEGLLQFERIDRLFRGRPCSQCRARQLQEKALKKLRQLYEASGGLYPGDNAVRQRQWLEREREGIGVKLELWFGDRAYRFVCEGDRYFLAFRIVEFGWQRSRIFPSHNRLPRPKNPHRRS